MSIIRLRPHHALCIQHFSGHGYSEEFTDNMSQVVATLKNNPSQEVLLCHDCDVLCLHCPHACGNVCEHEEKVSCIDRECLTICGFYISQQLHWGVLQKAVYDKIIMTEIRSAVCKGCSWLWLCEKFAIHTSM